MLLIAEPFSIITFPILYNFSFSLEFMYFFNFFTLLLFGLLITNSSSKHFKSSSNFTFLEAPFPEFSDLPQLE